MFYFCFFKHISISLCLFKDIYMEFYRYSILACDNKSKWTHICRESSDRRYTLSIKKLRTNIISTKRGIVNVNIKAKKYPNPRTPFNNIHDTQILWSVFDFWHFVADAGTERLYILCYGAMRYCFVHWNKV